MKSRPQKPQRPNAIPGLDNRRMPFRRTAFRKIFPFNLDLDLFTLDARVARKVLQRAAEHPEAFRSLSARLQEEINAVARRVEAFDARRPDQGTCEGAPQCATAMPCPDANPKAAL